MLTLRREFKQFYQIKSTLSWPELESCGDKARKRAELVSCGKLFYLLSGITLVRTRSAERAGARADRGNSRGAGSSQSVVVSLLFVTD